MTLARIHTWIAGEILTAAALNAEFNNLLANPTGLISPLLADLDFDRHQALDFVLENVPANPAPSTPGRLYYNTASQQVMVDTGSGTQIVGPNTSAQAGIGGRVRGLYGSLTGNIGSFAAFEYVFQTSNPTGASYLMTGMNQVGIAANTQTAGPVAGGRDQPGAFAGNQVHYYAITTGFNSTAPAALVSNKTPYTSDGGPTLPTSYVGWAYLVSAVYSTLTSAPVVPNQLIHGSNNYFITTSNFGGAGQGMGAGVPLVFQSTVTVETSVRVDAYVPAIAPSFQLQHMGTGGRTSEGGTNISCFAIVQHNFGYPFQVAQTYLVGTAGILSSGIVRLQNENGFVRLPNTNAPPSFVYYNINIPGNGEGVISINLMGHGNSNGDQE
jgi:hypothetical protein